MELLLQALAKMLSHTAQDQLYSQAPPVRQ